MRYRVSDRVFWAGVVLAGCALLGSGAGARRAPQDAVEARRFVLVGEDGETRAVLQLEPTGAAALRMTGPAGRENVVLTTGAQGENPTLTLFDAGGAPRPAPPVTPAAVPPAPAAATPVPQNRWHEVATFRGGTGRSTTNPFRTRRRWHVRYTLEPAEGRQDASLEVSLVRASDGRLVGALLGARKPISATAERTAPPGEYQLRIEASGRYEIVIEEER